MKMKVLEYLMSLALGNIIRARDSEEAFQKAYANLKHQCDCNITRKVVIKMLYDDELACDTTSRLRHMLGLDDPPPSLGSTEPTPKPAIYYWNHPNISDQTGPDSLSAGSDDLASIPDPIATDSTVATFDVTNSNLEDMFNSLIATLLGPGQKLYDTD